jgi:rhodanese-related sulfurtransferase
MKLLKISLLLIITLSLACKNEATHDNITLINSEEMLELMQTEDVQLVDVRTVNEFNEHYIQGAENIVFDSDFDQKLEGLQKNKPIIVYCRSGRRSAKCAEILARKGFTKIFDLKGGITQWMKEGNGVE